jgi:hypothetical protein
MTIKELITALQAHPNQNAIIKIKANASRGGEDEDMDLNLNEVEVWGEDDFNFDYVDLFCYNREGSE